MVGIGIFLLHGFGGLLTRDLALYAYSGQQFAEGVPPYVAVLNRAGPLAHMVPGLGAMIARALGTDDLLTMRVLMMVLSAVAVCSPTCSDATPFARGWPGSRPR